MKIAIHFSRIHMESMYLNIRNLLNTNLTFAQIYRCYSIDELVALDPDVIVSHESKELVDYLLAPHPNMKWIHFMSAGIDYTLSKLGANIPFKVSNVRGIHGRAMAEYVMCMMLYFNKNLEIWNENRRSRMWNRDSIDVLTNKRLLILGAGAIGSEIAKTTKTLVCEVYGVSRSGTPNNAFDKVFSIEKLDEVLPEVDFVVVSLPLTNETRGILNSTRIGKLSRTCVIINISRGEIIDEAALADAIEAGKIKGAALDAFSSEPLPNDSPFWSLKNVVVTPHVAGKFPNGHELGASVFVKNLYEYNRTGNLITEVFPARGY